MPSTWGALGGHTLLALALLHTDSYSAHAQSADNPGVLPTAAAEISRVKLRGGLHSPMPGGQLAGYYGDTGLDISGRYQPVYAVAAGLLDYAERGHTAWRGPRDTDYCVRIALDQPIAYRGHQITHLYYAHLSAVAAPQPENAPVRRHVTAGERLGVSGIANGVMHLHLGFILDGRVDQEYYADVLREWEIRSLLGSYQKTEQLPRK